MAATKEVRVTPKVRYSGSMESFLIEFVNEEAVREERSFSDMIGRLINEARWARINSKKKKK